MKIIKILFALVAIIILLANSELPSTNKSRDANIDEREDIEAVSAIVSMHVN